MEQDGFSDLQRLLACNFEAWKSTDKAGVCQLNTQQQEPHTACCSCKPTAADDQPAGDQLCTAGHEHRVEGQRTGMNTLPSMVWSQMYALSPAAHARSSTQHKCTASRCLNSGHSV